MTGPRRLLMAGGTALVPNALTVVGSVNHTNLNGARVVVAAGTYAYVVAEYANRLTIVDASSPGSPSVVGSTSVVGGGGSGPLGIAKSGNTCFVCVAAAGGGLVSVDVSNPASPSVLHHLAMSNCHSVAISGTTAYVSRQSSGRMSVVDISNPSAMSVTNTITTGTTPAGIDCTGGVVYMCDNGGNTLISIDPVTGVLDTVSVSGAHSVVTDGTYAYVSSSSGNTITTIDISTPTNILNVGSVTDANLNVPYQIAKSGSYLYAGAYNVDRVTAVSVVTPTSPSAGASVTSTNLDGVIGVAVSGSYIYAASQPNDRLTVIEIS